MDTMVLTVQQWLNSTYGSNPGYTGLFPNGIVEDGITGAQVEKALVTALQIELGISSPTGTFGPATTAAFTAMKIRPSGGNLTTPTNKEYILQGGFWCKGYNPGGWTGIFYNGTKAAVQQFQADAGLSNCDGVVTVMIMKALLNTDPFALTAGGDSDIRLIQQDLNNRYNAYTELMPTNGLYCAQTNKALIYALQAEEGLSTSVANGSFGPTTTTRCPTLSPGDTRRNYVILLQYALYCNGYPSGGFDGVYDSGVTSAVSSFQSFMCLPVTGIANMPTIKATMASCGDANRSAGACDCATILTVEKATALKNNGYQVVGRYLTGTVGGSVSKALTEAEIQIIFNAGLRFFPIYQTRGTSVSYFTPHQGAYDAYAAITAAENLGIPSGAVIYFAVDFDAMDYQVTSNVLPYFQAIKAYFKDYSSQKYQIGVYGARNTCSRVCNSGYAVSSFAGDMSTGYSGNIGFTMPANWAFDQFTTVTIGNGSGQIEIDKDGYSGRYAGVDHVIKSANTPTQYKNPPVQPSNVICSDPVDTSLGAHIIQTIALKVKGAQELSFDLSYSSAKLSLGTMGKGWSHNYEIGVVKVYNSRYVYWTPSDYSEFIQNVNGTYTCSDLGKQNDVLTVNADSSYYLNRNNDVKYSFDSTGQLTNIKNRVGMNINVSKDVSGKLIITEPISGQTLTVSYNSAGFVRSVSDQTGRTAVFNYDSNACLATITDANGKITTYTYDNVGRVLTGTDSDGICCFTDTYDDFGQIASQDDAVDGNMLTFFSYDNTSISGKIIVTITNRNGNKRNNVFNSSTRQLIATTDENGNTKTYTYDSGGNIEKETDAFGNTAITTYDSQNHPVTQIDRVGASTVKTYDGHGNLLSVVNPDGGTTTYTYDLSNRVITMTDSRSKVTTYTYDANGLLIEKSIGSEQFVYTYQNGLIRTVTDPNGGISIHSYDVAGRLISFEDANGYETTYTYDANGNQLSKTDPLGNTTFYIYDSRGKVLTQTDANGNTTTYQYNGNGKMISMTDPKGNATTYTYDGEDRLTQVEDAQGNTTRTAYDPAGNILNQTDAQGNSTAFTYDEVGNVLTATKPNGGVTTYTYYANGKLNTETDAVSNTKTYSYDDGWRLSKITNALGKDTTYVYNNGGDLLSVTDPLGNITTYTYDTYGNMLTMIDPNGKITTYTYDANHNRIGLNDAMGNVTTYAYDGMNRLIETTDANSHTSSIAYDASGKVIGRIDALGNTTSISYDPNGNIIEMTDALGNITSRMTYDATNLPLDIQDALGNTTSNTYDTLGRLIQTDDPLNNATMYEYDGSSRLVSALDALNGNSSVTYDVDGNKTSVQNPLGGLINYTYDYSGRLASETTVSGGTITYGYNALDLLSETTNARGQNRNFTFDDAGRIISFTDTEGTTSYTYDANGNILTVTDPKGIITHEFDALNRVIKATGINGNVLQYSYDPVGNLSSITYPDGKTVSYSYDAANRLATVTDWASRVTNYAYDAAGNLIEIERPDESILTQTYDTANRLTSVADNDANGNAIVSYSYTYDEDSRMTTESSFIGSVTASMVYDNLSRLIDKTDKDDKGSIVANYAYIYDANGNITSGVSQQQSTTMTYDINDKLSTCNGQDASFDLEGNMTECVFGGNTVNFTYDSGNRLVQAGNTIYTYDAEDKRNSSATNGQVTNYVYGNIAGHLSHLLVRTDPNGNNTYYIYGIGLIAHQDVSGYSTYHYDLRGSTVALTDSQGTVTDRYTYGAYGEILIHSGTSDTAFLYNGRDGVLTEANGLYYMRARYYAPELKRFINADTKKGAINNSKTLNVYAFVLGNPISMVDPSGMSSEPGYYTGNSKSSVPGDYNGNGIPDQYESNAQWMGSSRVSVNALFPDQPYGRITDAITGGYSGYDVWYKTQKYAVLSGAEKKATLANGKPSNYWAKNNPAFQPEWALKNSVTKTGAHLKAAFSKGNVVVAVVGVGLNVGADYQSFKQQGLSGNDLTAAVTSDIIVEGGGAVVSMAAGAIAGSFFCPVVGTIIGAGVGFLGGLIWDKIMDDTNAKENLTNTLRQEVFR